MEQLIIALIVGVIGFLVKRKTEGKETEAKPAPKDVFSPTKTPAATQRKIKKVAQTIETTINNEFAPLVEKMDNSHNPVNDARVINKFDEVKYSEKNHQEETKKIDIDESDLLKGIILAEVLGPPRAKKPYKSK